MNEKQIQEVMALVNAVAYLDIGAGGYMDLGTDMSDEALSLLPKGRHMLVIAGTYGVDGYTAAQRQEQPQQEREPMTDEQAFKSWKALREMKPSINAMSAFQAGIDLAERFHNITKEQQ